MAAALPFISAAFSVIGAISQGNAAADAAEYNADLAERNATIARQQGEAEATQQRRENYLRLSSIKAGYGASGVTGEGSPLDILESSAAQGELDIQNIKYNASLRALGFSDNATLNKMASTTARNQGYMQAAGASLSPFGKPVSLAGTGTKIQSGYDYSPAYENLA